MIKLDKWQEEILEYSNEDLCICSGRQTGKSTIVSILASEFVTRNYNKHILIVSITEDQAILLLQKCLFYLDKIHSNLIKKGKYRPTKSKIELRNGSIIRTKAIGQSGFSVLGYTNDMLIVDEAALVSDFIWESITPTLLTTGGNIILVSTPHGKRGFFYRAYHDEHFKTFHTNSIEVIEKREICATWTELQRDKAIGFIESERKRMSKREFGQQYLGQFIDELDQFFPDEIIRKAMLFQRQDIGKEGRDFYLGIDVARMGGDLTTFEIFERKEEQLLHRENIVWKYVRLSEITDKILILDSQWNFKKIYIDDGGIGVGVFDSLLTNNQTKRKVIALNNSKRIVEYNIDKTPKKKKLLKEDLYNNLLHLMEKGKIIILDDNNIWQSFKSVQYKYLNEKGGATMHIFGDDTHVVEGITRAAWCIKDKINKVGFSYI